MSNKERAEKVAGRIENVYWILRNLHDGTRTPKADEVKNAIRFLIDLENGVREGEILIDEYAICAA